MDQNSLDGRLFHLALEEFGVGITPNRQLSLRLGKPPASLGFDPDISFALELSPAEARSIADMLIRKAREAEGGSSQH